MFNRCVHANDVHVNLTATDLSSFLQDVSQDLFMSWYWILTSSCIAVALSVLLLILFRYAIKYVIWFILSTVIVVLIVGTFLALSIYFDLQKHSGSEKTSYILLITGIGMGVLALVFSFLVCCFRKRIQLVIKLFEEATKALADMPLLFLEPFLTFLAIGLSCVCFVSLAIMINSAGKAENLGSDDVPKVRFVRDYGMIVAQVVNLIAFIWFASFVNGCQNFIIAGTVSQWFFARTKSQIKSPINKSFKNLLRFHIGSVCLGSVILTAIKILRIVLTFVVVIS